VSTELRSWWLLTVMTLVGTLSFVDRYLFAILLQPIKSEFRLSDTLVGMLTGFAFALFYVVFSIPISAVADRGRRRAVIVTSILVWSAVTALTGKVTSVLQLAIARFGVGIGEAGVFPTSQAVIADAFPPERRTLAFAILASCSSLGLFIAFSAGGVLEAALGWRQTFLVLGAPGLIVAPLALMAIPRSKPVAATRAPGSGSMFRMLLADARFRHAVLALSAVIMISIGQVQWLPAFFERSFGGTRATIGPALGLTQAAATVTGLFLSGFAGNLLYRYDARLPLAVGLLGILATSVPAVLLWNCRDVHIAYLITATISLLTALPLPALMGYIQSIAPPSHRASAAALQLMISSILGAGAGPALVGYCSDLFAAHSGAESLRYALLTSIGVGICWGSVHLFAILRISAVRRLVT
jgi:MFS family permease